MLRRSKRRTSGLPLLLVAVVLLSACSRQSAPRVSGSVNVTLIDFHMSPATTTVPSGLVAFHIRNDAPATHEFVVVRTDLQPGELPIGADGLSIDEDQLHNVGELSEVQSASTDTLLLHLPPGRYVVFCNLQGHYLGGMHAGIEVTQG
jgi:uncharacterized cupredoxin-like copper-binding protein